MLNALFIHAHYDDYEFTAAGTFELWRRRLGADFCGRVLICTDGEAGHHCRTRAETGRIRLAEQQASARLGQFEFDMLRLPDGSVPCEGCLLVTPSVLAALWRAIREFEPDYLFCPPVPDNPMAGIHPDHQTVAEAVRRVAYMINVPHAFTPEYPADETKSRAVRTAVIVAVTDPYIAGEIPFALAVPIEDVLSLVAEMSWCHQSQIREWLSWVGRPNLAAPATLAGWVVTLRQRFEKRNEAAGVAPPPLAEFFRITAWGEMPEWSQLERDFPELLGTVSQLKELRRRLERWRS